MNDDCGIIFLDIRFRESETPEIAAKQRVSFCKGTSKCLFRDAWHSEPMDSIDLRNVKNTKECRRLEIQYFHGMELSLRAFLRALITKQG